MGSTQWLQITGNFTVHELKGTSLCPLYPRLRVIAQLSILRLVSLTERILDFFFKGTTQTSFVPVLYQMTLSIPCTL